MKNDKDDEDPTRIYVAILVGSVVVSALLRLVPTSSRATASAVVGIAFVVGACANGTIQLAVALLLALLNYGFTPRSMRRAGAFALAFGHLGILRVLEEPQGATNAALLVLVLRLASLGDVEEGPRSATELIQYACCYHGLFTAPWYTYAEWSEAMRAPQPLPTAGVLGRATLKALGAVLLYLSVKNLFPYEHALDVKEWEFWSYTAWARFSFFYISSFQFRWRFYVCWLVMRISALLIGFASTSNVDLVATELCTSPSGYIAGWNMSVQAWLKAHVYRPLPRRTPRVARQLAVFLVSSFWHGVQPGYYLCFAGMLVMVNVEALVRSELLPLLPPWATRGALGALLAFTCHIWTMSCFCFTGLAFNLLQFTDILSAWHSFSYYGVWLTAVPGVFLLCLRVSGLSSFMHSPPLAVPVPQPLPAGRMPANEGEREEEEGTSAAVIKRRGKSPSASKRPKATPRVSKSPRRLQTTHLHLNTGGAPSPEAAISPSRRNPEIPSPRRNPEPSPRRPPPPSAGRRPRAGAR